MTTFEAATATGLPRPVASPSRLTILYDEKCAVCRRARDWLATQPCLVPVELLPAGSDEARRRYDGLPWLGAELVVVDEAGNAWVGPAAFLASMWATARWRPWAFRLSRPGMAPHAERFFLWVSKRRTRWGARMDNDDCTWCEEVAADATCLNGHAMPSDHRYCTTCGVPRAGVESL